MECNCNNNNSNGGVIPWVRGNRLPLIICVYENVVTQEQVGDSTLTVNEMTRVPYTIQDNDTVTVIMKSGFRQVEMPFTTDGNKVMVTDNGELPTGAYTVEVTIERGDGARGRWQETRQVRIYENTSDAQLGEMYSIDADLFFYAKGDTGTGIADITNNPDNTLTITMTDGTTYTTEAVKGEKGDKGDTGERGVSIVSFDVTGQTDVSVIYTVTFSDDTTQDISVPKGPQGDTGLTGNGISTTTLNSDYTLTVNYTDGTTYTTPSIRGAQGAQGVSVIGFTQTGETATNTMYNLVFSDGRTQSVAIPKGVKGDKGDTGNTGPQGAQGPKGDTVTATDYTLYGVQGSDSQGAMSQDATTKAISAQTGYYTCGTLAGTTPKVVTVENGNLYKRTLGGHFKVKMTNKNTAASGVTLQVGSETAAALWYNGATVSASNTWDAGEVISVYYDGTYYQASNSQGGSNKKIDAYLYGDLRTLAVGKNYEIGESVQTSDKQLRKIDNEVKTFSFSETLSVGNLRTNSNKTYKVLTPVATFNPSTEYSEGAYALGRMAEYELAITAASVTAGNITVNGVVIPITDGESASDIASSIAANVTIDGWTLSAEDNIVTVRCNTIGAKTTSITFTDTDSTGVVLEGNTTPSIVGTNVIMKKYDGSSWAEATIERMEQDGIIDERSADELVEDATQQNSVFKDFRDSDNFVNAKSNKRGDFTWNVGGIDRLGNINTYNNRYILFSKAGLGNPSEFVIYWGGITGKTATLYYKNSSSKWIAIQGIAVGYNYIPTTYSEYLLLVADQPTTEQVKACVLEISVCVPVKDVIQNNTSRIEALEEETESLEDRTITVITNNTQVLRTGSRCWTVNGYQTSGVTSYATYTLYNNDYDRIIGRSGSDNANAYAVAFFSSESPAMNNLMPESILFGKSGYKEFDVAVPDGCKTIVLSMQDGSNKYPNYVIKTCRKSSPSSNYLALRDYTFRASHTTQRSAVVSANATTFSAYTGFVTNHRYLIKLNLDSDITSVVQVGLRVTASTSSNSTIIYNFGVGGSKEVYIEYKHLSIYNYQYLYVWSAANTNAVVTAYVVDLDADTLPIRNEKRIDNLITYGKYGGDVAWFPYSGAKIIPNRYGYRKLVNTGFGQGYDIYNGYAIGFANNGHLANIYNFNTGVRTENISTGQSSASGRHCNCVSFSKVFYDSSDMFPLIYVSGYEGTYTRTMQVFRLQKKGESYTITKIQDITFPPSIDYANVAMDANNMWFCNPLRISKTAIPSIFDGSNNVISSVEMSDSDIIDSFAVPEFPFAQGVTKHGNLIYRGWGTTDYYIQVIDVVSKSVVNSIHLNDYNAAVGEPEDIAFWGDRCIINFATAGLYEFFFE